MREFNCLESTGSLYKKDYIKSSKRSNSLLGIGSQAGHQENLVEIVAYCLNPNHYHLLLKQEAEKGISKFMHKLGIGYTNYFNKRYDRTGLLFQGKFKFKEIKSDVQLLYVSAYINGNPQIHKIAKADKWIYGSYLDYLGKRQGKLANKDIILKEFENIQDYQEYVNEVIKNSSEIKEEIKKCLIEVYD